MTIQELADALGVSVTPNGEPWERRYFVEKNGGRKVEARAKTLRAIVCEVGGDPLDD